MVSRSLYQMNVPVGFDDGENEEGYCELDSHADTTAAGSNMVLLNPDQITTHVDVAPFSEEYKPIKKIPIGSCAAAWTNPTSGQVYIIVFHQALYFGDKLKNSLICPNQVRDCNFNSVEETPRQFDSRSKHGITIQTPLEDDDPKKVFIKLSMRNVISYFPTRKPTRMELDECQHLIATNDTPWDPHSLKFRMAELAIDNGDPISGDQFSLQAMSTEDDQTMDTSSVVTEPASNVTEKLPKTSLDKRHPNLTQQCKLMRVHQVSTRRMLTECQIATDGNIAHRISSVRNISNSDEVTKGHIANLLSKCVIKHVRSNGSTQRMRSKTEFDAAAKHAIQTNTDGEPTVLIELTITHWRFRRDWNASLFNKIYEDQSVILPSSPAPIPSDTNNDNVLPSSFRTLSMQAYARDPPSTTAKLLPVQPAEANDHVNVPSGTTGLVHTKTIDSNNVKTSLNPSTAPRASLYTWTWTYSPNSDTISFQRSSVKRQEKSAVTALPVMPPTLPSSDHHPVPLYEPTDFRWTFNPQSESVVFHRLPKPTPVPLKPSLQLPLLKAFPEGTILSSAIPTFEQHGAYPSHICCAIYSNPNQTVFCITKRHHDALKIKMYHLYAKILSMNWFYNTID
eukprot:jgi/Psemu1/15430/gm1.15430_g